MSKEKGALDSVLAAQLCDEDSSVSLREAFSVGSVARIGGHASLVAVRLVVAIRRVDEGRALNGVDLGASRSSVQCHLVTGLQVDTFESINFTKGTLST